tara:strand:+ start:1112823 stop:1113266 length:444 start_codon:yes stop_codon:yes gene_type:complete
MKKRVLLIDDDEDIVRGTNLRLRASGYDTLFETDGEAGYQSAVQTLPDAVVLDVRMCKKSGLEVLADLKGNAVTRDIPVVMLSASLIDQTAALDGGARFFLRKPYQGEELLAAIGTAIEGSSRSATKLGALAPTIARGQDVTLAPAL